MKSLILSIAVVLLLWTVAHSMNVLLQWDPNRESNLAGYKVYYKGMGITPWIYHSTVIAPTTTATITGLTTDGRYLFYVTAFNNVSTESNPSNIVRVNVRDAKRTAGGNFGMR